MRLPLPRLPNLDAVLGSGLGFPLHRLRRRLLTRAAQLSGLALALAAVLFAGLASSWYMVEAGFSLTTRTVGPWVMWTNTARPDADPYTRAHFAKSGALFLSTDIAHTYLARTDGEGLKLHSSCDYLIEMQPLDARWWSITAFDEHGRLIPNSVQRSAFTSDTASFGPDGRAVVSLARDARPGNWLPTGGAGRVALLLVLIEPRATGQSEPTPALPDIRKVGCR